MSQPINLADKLSRFTDLWSPRVIAELNDYQVKLAKLEGEFVWHSHAHTDELFLIIEGQLTIELRDRAVTLGPGELYIVPRGVEHRPVAHRTAEVLMFEPAQTRNTGDVDRAYTIEATDLERI